MTPLLLGVLALAAALGEGEAGPVRSRRSRDELVPHPVPAHVLFSSRRTLRAPPPPEHLSASYSLPPARWLTQYLDHFDPTNNRTWQQRWFMENSTYKEDGPAFLFIEGEGTASSKWLVWGHAAQIAKDMGASFFMLEHRYYGESHPTEDFSTSNLRWLSSEQALADLAYFIDFLLENGYIKAGTKIVSFGGSYSGNLSAWLRLKYPHLVYAAVASSGPFHAKADFVEYLQTVGRSLKRKGGSWCVNNIKKGVKRAKKLISSGSDGAESVLSIFLACNNIDLTNTLDYQSFFSAFGNAFSGAVQYNRPVADYPDTISEYCSRMGYEGEGTITADEAMERLANVTLWDADVESGYCLDYSYNGTLSYINNVTLSTDAYRQWTYQTCTEFGYFQSDDSDDNPFGQGLFPLSYFVQQCRDAFGERFNDEELNYGIELTNTQYGADNLDVHRVIFVNGDIDPWHTLSRLTSVNSESPSIFISGTSHCYDMYPPDPLTDPPNLTAARKLKEEYLQKLLYDSTDGTLLSN